ncbi:MAG: tyrosine-type recombinase/integrase [Thermodesulfobacteriota bacterium]
MNSLPTSSPRALKVPAGRNLVPLTVGKAGAKVAHRFLEFFTVQVRNKNTRVAYHTALTRFFSWCEGRGVELEGVEPTHVAAYLEGLRESHSIPTVKQHLAAIRMLMDWLVLGRVLEVNPASCVRGPRYSLKKGKTPVLVAEEARALIDRIDTSHVVGLRDRAIISVLLYAFARVEATVSLNVEDYFPQGKRWWVRLHEKGGKRHEMPVHHKAEEYVDSYIKAAGLEGQKKVPLFRTAIGKTRELSDRRMSRKDVYEMVRRRAKDAGIQTRIGCHTFRATGITNYLENGGTLEKAQQMAAHESARTTKLYDRRSDEVSLDEVERISI